MQVIHKLKMDLLRQNNTQIIDAVQLDSNTRKLELSLYEGAMPWAVPDGVLVAIAYMCDDSTRGVYDTLPDDSTAYEIDGNKITITVIPDALAVVGETKMTIIVSSSASKQDSLATFPVTFRVAENYSVDAKDPEGYVNLRGWLESEIDKILESSSIKFSAIKRVNREYETNDYLLSLTYHTEGSDVQSKAKMLMYLSANGVDFRKVAAMPIDFDKKIYDLSTIYFNDMWTIAFDCIDYEYNEWTQENRKYNRGGNRVGIITTTDFIEFKQVYVELPLEWKSTWAPELFVVDGKLHMIITTSTCTVTRDTASGGKTYVKDGIYICRLNDDFTLESYQQITLPDDGIAPDNYIDGFIYQADGVYYLGIKEETNKKQRIYQSSDLYGDYTLVHEFEEQVEGLAIVKFNDRYFAYSDKYVSGGFYQEKGTAISVSSDLQTWSGHAMANVDGDAWNRHFTPFVVSTSEQKQSIDNFLKSFGPVDAALDAWSKKSYRLAAGTGKYNIERLLIQPDAVYYISGGADLTIDFVDTSLMSHGDTCKFIISSMASNAKITFKYNEGNTLFWDNLEDLVFAKSNGVLTVTCGNGVANKYCFAEVSASSGTDYILPVATPNRLGGVKPVEATEDMTQSVGVDENGGLWTVPGGINPPATAAVGQTIVVKAVDENGKPTEWEAADLGDKVVTIFSFTAEEDVERLQIPLDHSLDDVLSRCKVLEFQARINKSSTGQNPSTASLNACLEVWGPDAVFSASSSVFFLDNTPCIPSVDGAQYCDVVAIVPMNSYRTPMFGERGICMQWGLYEAETVLFWPFIPQPGDMYVLVDIPSSAGIPTFIGAGSTFEIRAWGSLT